MGETPSQRPPASVSPPPPTHTPRAMGRGSQGDMSSSPVPVMRGRRGGATSPVRLRQPGGGFNHKLLNDTTKGNYEPLERKPLPSQSIGNRNRVGRANTGASNRRTTNMPTEIVNATGKVALNTSAILHSSPERVAASLPGKKTDRKSGLDLTAGLRFAQSEVERRNLQGPLHHGRGASPTRHHNPGAETRSISFSKPPPKKTSARGRQVDNLEKQNSIKVVKQDGKLEGMATVKFEPRLSASPGQSEALDASVIRHDRAVSAPPVLPRIPKTDNKLREAKPTLPVFRHTIKDSDFDVPLKRKPRDVAKEYTYKNDQVMVPPGLRGQVTHRNTPMPEVIRAISCSGSPFYHNPR